VEVLVGVDVALGRLQDTLAAQCRVMVTYGLPSEPVAHAIALVPLALSRDDHAGTDMAEADLWLRVLVVPVGLQRLRLLDEVLVTLDGQPGFVLEPALPAASTWRMLRIEPGPAAVVRVATSVGVPRRADSAADGALRVHLNTTETIAGRITGRQGAPLSNATIWIDRRSEPVVADDCGYFCAKLNAPTAPRHMRIRFKHDIICADVTQVGSIDDDQGLTGTN
jgi:hypothetical protein